VLRFSAWIHILLTVYLWLVAAVPLGNWNRQHDPQLIPALLHGSGISWGDVSMLAFVTLPAVLFWIAYRQQRIAIGILALAFDLFWLWMQIQSWWIPYLWGAGKQWQIDYAKGPTTKVLPSFGRHVAPDGMHFAIHLLLVAALLTGCIALVQLRRGKARAALSGYAGFSNTQ
jgi:hypothetical protein